MSSGFFTYFWLSDPRHPYDLHSIPHFHESWAGSKAIFNLDQLYWGLYRFHVDALLYFGNVRAAYQLLRDKTFEELMHFFEGHMLDTEQMVERGPPLPLEPIGKYDRYLIAEKACKSYEPNDEDGVDLETALREACRDHFRRNPEPVTLRMLLEGDEEYVQKTYPDKQSMFEFAADEILGEWISDESHLGPLVAPLKQRFEHARSAALENTKRYLSSVRELDVYVATSMRKPQNFHDMADFCERVFADELMWRYNLRYFDPTMSAAGNHEDKGLIECLMVKCAKLLLYTAGDADSYGKDAEAAMALSLGKPVIFFCDGVDRQNFYKNVHPLSRLVNFETGVAVGAIVTDSESDVVILLERLFTNRMQYVIHEKKPGYLVLKEALTGSVVRLQTDDALLRETFWNHYLGSRANTDFLTKA
jgi:hypothetical protein